MQHETRLKAITVAASRTISKTHVFENSSCKSKFITNVWLEVQRSLADISRCKKNVVFTGLPEPQCGYEDVNLTSDQTAFLPLCEEHWSTKPLIVTCIDD